MIDHRMMVQNCQRRQGGNVRARDGVSPGTASSTHLTPSAWRFFMLPSERLAPCDDLVARAAPADALAWCCTTAREKVARHEEVLQHALAQVITA